MIGEETDESESSIYTSGRINRIVDKNKKLTTTVRMNGIEKEFIIDTGSPISIMPADKEIMKETEIQKIKQRYQGVNKNEVKFRGEVPVEQKKNKKQKLQLLITERNDITPPLGIDWLKKFKLTIRNIRTDRNSQSEKRRVISNFQDLFKNTAEINIQLKPGHYPV